MRVYSIGKELNTLPHKLALPPHRASPKKRTSPFYANFLSPYNTAEETKTLARRVFFVCQAFPFCVLLFCPYRLRAANVAKRKADKSLFLAGKVVGLFASLQFEAFRMHIFVHFGKIFFSVSKIKPTALQNV